MPKPKRGSTFKHSSSFLTQIEFPTVAVDVVEIEVSSSVLNNEFITHPILGFIPLTSERGMSMRFSRDGDWLCEFCPVEFRLSAKCVTNETLDVTSKDLYSADPTVTLVAFGSLLVLLCLLFCLLTVLLWFTRNYHCETAHWGLGRLRGKKT